MNTPNNLRIRFSGLPSRASTDSNTFKAYVSRAITSHEAARRIEASNNLPAKSVTPEQVEHYALCLGYYAYGDN